MNGVDELCESIVGVLRDRPHLTARELVRVVKSLGYDADRSLVNSLLYRHSELFQRDDDVPPKWSLAHVAPIEARRTPHRVSGLKLENWKVFEGATVPCGPVTLVFGENSSGKSSLFQSLLLMKQSWGYGDLRLEGKLASFGWYEHVVHQHDMTKDIGLTAFWGDPGEPDLDNAESGIMLTAPHGDVDLAYNPDHPLGRIVCFSADGAVALMRAGTLSAFAGRGVDQAWVAFRIPRNEPVLVKDTGPLALPDQPVIMGADDQGFPELSQVQGLAGVWDYATFSRTQAQTLATIGEVLSGAGEMLDAVEHIGPARTVPQRDIRLSWARDNCEYLARLFENNDLVLDVNEWLTRFEIPYLIEIARYGDDDGDEIFELDLRRDGGAGEKVQLRDVGFGVSQILPILVQLLGSREKTILIEEPEAHVHPRLQSMLGDLFVTSSQDYGNVLLVETHSEPILLRLQRRIAEGRVGHDEVAVLHVIRHGQASHVEIVPIEPNGQLDYQWPGGFFDDRMDDLIAILDPRPEG